MRRGPRVVVIGLDGATFELLDPVLERGWMPVLGQWIESGARGPLEAPTPPVTGPSWASFMTGRSPAGHGVFSFTERLAGRYERQVISARSVRAPTLWGLLDRAGLRTGAFNVPLTYPPPSVDGFVVSGFLTPDSATDTCRPPELAVELEQRFGRLDLDDNWRSYGREGAGAFLEDARRTVERTAAVARHLLERRPCDLFVMVHNSIDRLQHYQWDRLVAVVHGERDPHADAVELYFRTLDAALADTLDAAGDGPRTTLVLSDHGFGPFRRTFAVNQWLARRGLLTMRGGRHAVRRWLATLDVLDLRRRRWRGDRAGRPGSVRVDRRIDWSRTRAYAISNAEQGLYVNLVGREPCGTVHPDDYDTTCREIVDALRAIRDPVDGRPLLSWVARREELHTGPYLDEGPDVSYGLDGFETLGVVGLGGPLFEKVGWYDGTGVHRYEGLLVAHGPEVRPGTRVEGARMVDVAPTLLHLLGASVPDDLDGKVLRSLFVETSPARRPVSFEPARTAPTAPAPTLASLDARELEERLRGLGYID